jgi:hypothetical protein
MKRIVTLSVTLAATLSLKSAPVDDMAMSKAAAIEASDMKHTGGAESPSEYNNMNTGEMTMSQ